MSEALKKNIADDVTMMSQGLSQLEDLWSLTDVEYRRSDEGCC